MASRFGTVLQWFPGHMATAVETLATTLPRCDVVVEVRDARLPWTSANPLLAHLIATASNAASLHHIVVLNKADLASPALAPRVAAALMNGAGGARPVAAVLSTQAVQAGNVGQLVELVDSLPSRATKFRTVGKTMVIVGCPNVGKSTLLNAFRQRASSAVGAAVTRRGAKTGSIPGITRSVTTFLVRPAGPRAPPLYMFDSPGVMAPRLDDAEAGLKLVVAGIVPEHKVPWAVQVEFLLHTFARLAARGGGAGGEGAAGDDGGRARRPPRYVQALQLPRSFTPDETAACLALVAQRLKLQRKGGGGGGGGAAVAATRSLSALDAWDLEAAGRHFVRAYQAGELGRFTLDEVPGDGGGAALR